MIILRERKNNNLFLLKNNKNEVLKDKKIHDYVKSLVIPPAYTNVKIFMVDKPKILFEGYDAKGRKQQIYSPQWRGKKNKEKMQALLSFGKSLPKIQGDVNKYINNKKVTKKKLISLILHIISICYFRVGNIKYQKLYGSYGISNIKVSHVSMLKDIMRIRFIGKKGVDNRCDIIDKRIINELIKKMES
jgi:DNA topoisomerase-1